MSAFGVWVAWATWHDRRRQRALAATRPSTTGDQFVEQMAAAGVPVALAEWMLDQIGAYYTAPLTSYASDRIYSELRIDPDDISDIALWYKKEFGVRLAGNPISMPADPTWAEFARKLLEREA